MGRGEVVVVVLLVVGVCVGQVQNGSGRRVAGMRSGNGGVKSVRAIEVGGARGNRLAGSGLGEDESSPDSYFDNSPIHFGDVLEEEERRGPVRGTVAGVQPTVHKERWTAIPLEELVRLGNELDPSKFLRDYVSNAKVVTDKKTYDEILANENDVPLLTSGNETVVVRASRPAVSLAPASRIGPSLDRTPVMGRTFTTAAVETRHGILAKQSKPIESQVCSPEKTTVTFPITVPPHMMIVPRCAKVERCGGCCLAHIMSCEPEQKETVKFNIRKLAWTGAQGKPFEYVDDEVVELEKHTKCKCKCKTKASDCYPRQVYQENKCSCECTNLGDYESCLQDGNKVWDPDNCMCLCKQNRQCSTGHYFDFNSCQCEKVAQSSSRRSSRKN